MKKEAILFILLSPLIYLYGLAENHFSFSNSIRGYTLEFGYEYINAWRVLFGKEYKNKSVEVALYEYKLKAKKTKFDLEIAMEMKKIYGSWDIISDKKKRKLTYRSGHGDIYLSISQLGKDEFKLKYYNDSGWIKKRTLSTDYIFSKEEVISTIQLIKEKS